ncbi:hypothetical protein Psuf_042750 [Phytohabitans suffuscus]|uniref:Uncharacterized protein n=1 Tax=Phytohabitans suffuscus TaxID=624315 RepID=A0A6F8YLH1_9ACTN|nr:hypothetical protein Psuf_042750 [Phytohabitans suffuscus]
MVAVPGGHLAGGAEDDKLAHAPSSAPLALRLTAANPGLPACDNPPGLLPAAAVLGRRGLRLGPAGCLASWPAGLAGIDSDPRGFRARTRTGRLDWAGTPGVGWLT